MNQKIQWTRYSIMLFLGLAVFVASIVAAFNYILETSKSSAVYQAYDYFILLQAQQQLDRLAYRVHLAGIDLTTAKSDHDHPVSLAEQVGITQARFDILTSGENGERLRLMPGLPEFKTKVMDVLAQLEAAVDKPQTDYYPWFTQLQQLSYEFSRFSGSMTGGLLKIQEEFQHSKSLLPRYLAAILISGILVLLLYGFALRRTIITSKMLAHVNLQLESESEQLRQAKETLFNQAEALFDQAEALFYQASHDPLTNLLNRQEFEHRLQKLLRGLQQYDEEHVLCYMDLDQFKVINDTCGHTAGDELLRQISSILSKHVREQDTLSRLGGDEFAVLLINCHMSEAARLAETFREAVQNFRFIWQRKIFELGVSIGLVRINRQSGTLADILSDADAACYIAKENGRNRVHIYESDDQTIQRHRGEMAWVSRIRQTLEDNRFRLYHQPIVPVDSSVIEKYHYEVLVRMLDEEGQLVPPITFLPAAERYNLMPTLDRWIIQTLFAWLVAHPQRLDELAVCSINLSGTSIGDKSFSDFIAEQLTHYALPTEKICFEVTETAAIANLTEASKFMRLFKDRGCHFSLDDFGSGMSSFAYLKNLPVDYLKIDGGFVKNMVTDSIDHAMVEAIHRVGHVMGLKTIAEYVENQAILEELRKIGVDYAQGYGISKPKPLVE